MSDDEGGERQLIRERVANMSFEELAKLKRELGGQAYNEAVFGVKKQPCVQKRLNKNRPAEISSKIRPEAIARRFVSTSRMPAARDPRFDHLCGEYSASKFKKDYSFVKDIKEREKVELKKQLKREKNDAKKEKIKFLISRMENQEREEKKLIELKEKKKEEFEKHIQMLREGKKPYFQKKSEKRLLDLVEQYENLKKKGKVNKVIEKHRRKKRRQDSTVFNSTS